MRKLPLHDVHDAEDARFMEYAGWQLPLMYVSIIAEHQQVRMRAGITDLSYMGKIEITGKERHKFIERHSSSAIDAEQQGRAYYSLMLTPEATIFADMLVYVRENSYLLTVNPLTTGNVLERLQESVKEFDAKVKDLTSDYALFSIQGRKSPMLLQRVTDVVLSDIFNNRFCEAFVGGEKAILARTSYTGEDGFELFADASFAQELWYKLLDVGQAEQLVPAGIGARSTLRLEASYPLYGDELTDEVNPLEADLVFAANSEADYIGKEELEKLRKRGVKRKLCGLVVNARVVARKGHEVLSEGKKVGEITRGIPSPTLRRNIALAYLPVELSVPGSEVEVVIRGNHYPAVVTRKPFYLKRRPVRRS
jgi:aminomethyltransferase